MVRLLVSIILVTAMLVGCASGQSGRRESGRLAGIEERTIEIGGRTRHFLVQDANVRSGAAIVVVLHGGSQSMREIFGSRAGASRTWRDIAREEGILLLAPNGTNARTGDAAGDNQNWADVRGLTGNRDEDVRFILATIDWALKRYSADPRRVYVTGASNGGLMTYTLLMDAPDRFAAGAAFIANLPAANGNLKQPDLPTPMLIMNGTDDPLMPHGGGEGTFDRGEVRSAPATAAWWVEANRAAPKAVQIRLPDLDPDDGCSIRGERHTALPGGAPVIFYTVEGGGHAAPTPEHTQKPSRLASRLLGPLCRDVDSSRVAWEFMSRHQR